MSVPPRASDESAGRAPRFRRTRIARACAALVAGAVLGAAAPHALAATAAGTQIKNLATVTYEDAAGNVYSAQSNEAVVTVAQVYSASIGVDVDATATPGQTVYLPYVLANTGNGADTFDLAALDGITAPPGDTIDAAGITIYRDTNGSGEPDAGEPTISQLDLAAGESANLVVAVQVPATATAADTLGVTLTAQARQGTGAGVPLSVTDLSSGGGRDGADGTNESLITVTGDAVLVTTKNSVHDAANNRITYTVTVRNNGNRSATGVVIHDALPAGTTLVGSSVSGILDTNGDTVNTEATFDETALGLDLNADGDALDANETTLGIDLNNDGDTDDAGVAGVYAVDAELPPQTSVSLTLTVEYDPVALGGGYTVENRGHAAGDTDGDGTSDSLVSSNQTQDTIGAAFGVTLTDTGAAGNDADAQNDDQLVAAAAAGGTVDFQLIVTNGGNADDIFELAVSPGDFPAGTSFAFYDDTGLVQLSDTNGSGPDTGVIAPGEARTFVVRASLPANAAPPATEYQATVTATSATDPQGAPVSDAAFISLGDIVTAEVDIHNAAGGAPGTDDDALGAAPYAAVTTVSGQTGTTVSFPLFIDNESGGSDSYVLQAGGSYIGDTLGALPAGWSVEFFLADGAGLPTGSAITTTPVIPAGQVDFQVVAVVSVPADATLAVEDYLFDNDGNAATEPDNRLDTNNDGDGDYPIFFRVASLNTGAADVKLDAVDINATRRLSLVNAGSNQVEPGGTVDYGHTLTNAGNVDELVELTSANNQPGFTHTVSIDTDGDGVPDTAIGNLPAGTSITVQQPDGTDVTVEVTDADGDSVPELQIAPGESLPLAVTVFAPANAAPGVIDILSIVATDDDGTAVQVDDRTTVIDGQVRLTKSVAVDADCDGEPDDPASFAAVQNAGIAPQQCAVWQVVAENQGAADALNVTVTDAVTAYSTYLPGSLRYCLTTGCVPAAVSDATGDDAGEITGSTVTFLAGTGAAPGAAPPADRGGRLVPGQQATARFAVRVE